MGYREFSGDLDGAAQQATTSYVEFDGQLDDPARRPLPPWTAPSRAGAGRGYVNPQTVEPPGLLDRAASALQGVIGSDDEAAGSTRSRGGLRSEVKPFVGGDERIERSAPEDGVTPDPLALAKTPEPGELAQWQIDAEYLSRSPESQQRNQAARTYEARIANSPHAGPGPARRGVDVAAETVRDVVDVGGSRTLAGQAAGKATQAAGDLALSSIRIIPETLQLANDILQLGTGGLTQGFSRVMEATGKVIGEQQSTKLASEHAALMNIMRDPDAGPSEVARFLLAHPEYSLNAALPSVGSMAIGAGGGRLGANFARALAARRGAVGAEIAAAMDRGAAIGATAANAAMNAGSTFDQTRGDLADKYLAAGIAGAGTAAAGKFFDGGAEAMLARGAVAASRSAAVAGTAFKEAGQEAFESLSQGVGQAVGEDRSLDPNALLKQATLEGGLGALIGGGAGLSVAVGGQERTAEQLARSKGFLRPVERARVIDDRVDDFGVTHGVSAKAVQAAKAEAAKLPLEDRVPYLKRVMAAYQRNGLVGRQFDDAALTLLDEPPEPPSPAPPEPAPALAEASIPQSASTSLGALVEPSIEQQMADRLARRLGIGNELAGAAERSEDDAPLTTASSEDMAGDTINRQWVAFKPETGSLNIPREQLPQIKAEHRGALVNFMNARGITHEAAEVPAGLLKPTQAEFSPQRVQRARDFTGGDRSILVSSDGYVLDGHHQWLARLDSGAPVKVIRLDAPIQDLLRLAHQFPSSTTAPGPRSSAPPNAAAPAAQAAIESGRVEAPVAAAPESVSASPAPPAQAAPMLDSAGAEQASPRRRGNLVETWTGTQKKGMLLHAAQSQMRDQQKRRPDLQWSIVPAPEFAEDRFKLEGREPVPEFTVGDRISIDGSAATVQKVAKAHIVATEDDGGKKRTIALDSPTMERIRAARQAAPPSAPAAPAAVAAQATRKSTPQARARAARQLDAERDTVLQTLAKLGGIRREALAKEFGMKPEEMRHTVMVGALKSYPFRKEGMSLDRALEALVEAGYFRGVDPADQMRALEDAIFDEMAGAPTLTVDGQVRAAELSAAEEAERAALMAEEGLSEAEIEALPESLTDDDILLDEPGDRSTEGIMRGLGFTEQEIADELARRKAETPADRARQAARDVEAQPAEGAQAVAAAGQEEGRGLTLAAQSAADLQAKTDREAAAAKADAAEQRRLADKARADAERGEFALTGSDRAADTAAAAGQGDLLSQPAAEEKAPQQGGTLQTKQDEAGNVMLQDLSRVSDRIAAMGYQRQDVERIQAARRLNGLIQKLDDGKITEAQFELSVRVLAGRMDRVVTTKAANRLMSQRERGADYVRERLLRARRQGDIDPDTVEFALWALDQNPALADNLGVGIRSTKGEGAAGDYNPAAEIMRLFKGRSHEDTAVHEIMHHAERMMPGDMQAAIRREWAAALGKAIKKATPEQRAALERIPEALAGSAAAYKELTNAISKGPLNYDEHYQLVNPSEFWAVNAARLLGNRYATQGSIWARARNWLREMVQKLRGLVGIRSDASLLRALNHLLDQDNFGPERSGRFESGEMLSDKRAVAAMGDVLASRSEPTRQAYERRIDELFATERASSDGAKVLDRSDVMGLLGHPDVPLLLDEEHLVREGLGGHPEMTPAMWKRVPEWIEAPALAYQSRGRVVMVAPERVAGYPVLMVIDPSHSSARDPRGAKIQLLVTAYAKTKGSVPWAEIEREKSLLYWDTQKAPAIGGDGRVQFPPHAYRSWGRGRILTEKQLAGYRRAQDESDPSLTSRGTGRGVALSDADAAVALIRQALPKAPPIVVLDDVRKAPAELVRFFKRIGAMNDVEAVYHAGKVYVFPQHIESIDRLKFVVGRHEIRHYGLDVMLGRTKSQTLLGIAMKNDALMADAKKKVAQGKASTLIGGIEEAMADMPVEQIAALTGIDRLVARVRQWLREMAATLREKGWTALADAIEPQAWTDNDIAAFVSKAEDVSRRGVRSVATGGTMMARDPERLALQALSENDEMFALPKSDKKTVEDITADNDPNITVRATVISSQETMYRLTMADGSVAFITQRKPNPYGPSVYGYEADDTTPITTRPGDNPDDVDADAEDVWIDVSRLRQGGDGDMVYNIAATYAHNTDRVFIGDPAGVSSDAMRRRSEHMLSSALKFGTTRHLAPHPDQVKGKDGVPGLRWVYGDDIGNIRRLVDLAVRKMENDFPESKKIDYDIASGEYINTDTGRRIRRDRLVAAVRDARSDRGAGRRALAGGRTVARAAVWRALLREEGSASGSPGQRDGLLARLARVASDLADADPKQRIFYSRRGDAEQGAGDEPRLSRHTPEQKKALERAGIGGLPPQAESEGHELPGESPARWFQRKTQDGLNRFTVLREWAVDNGLAMSPDSNVWAFEERMHGRVATRVEDFRERRLQPLVKSIQAAGFTMDEVAQYLHAQHAEERNRQIEKIDPDNKAGSGMSTQDAAEILASADPKLAALANEVRSITDDTRRILLEAGIISGEMADAWQATYKHYVPLKGDAQAQTGIGKGLSVNGRQHRALGHGERDERIVENILRDHERSILLAEKNTVGHALLAFITELANDEIATVGKPQKRKALLNSTDYEVVNRNGDSVATFDSLQAANAFIRARGSDGLTTRPVKGDAHVAFTSSPALADNEVQVYVKGHAVRVQLNDPILARAYRGIGVERLNQLMALNRQVNTWLSKAYTGLNPEFLLVNITRDFSTGLINIIGNYGVGVAAKAVVNYPKSFAAVLRYSFGGEATPALKAYRDAGGSTGAAYLSDLERVGLDVQHAYDQYQGVLATLKDGRPTAALMTANRKLLGAFAGWVEHLNAAGENAMRLAVFDALRSTDGYTVNDAASAAKNATVNFNRKGEWGQVLNSMYLFYNANVQGTAAMADALVHGKHRRQAWAVLAMLPAAAFALASAQFDEDEWRRIPDYVKSRSIIIRTGRKTYATLPIPYGYGWFWSLGNAMVDLRHGRSIDKVALNIANGLLENFSPVNPLGDTLDPRGMVELLPGAVGGELMRAGARLAVNRSSLGRDIVPDSKFDENRPDSLRMWRSTKGTLADKAAGALNRWTGGTKTQAGGIDVSPETLKYWAATVTGGAGTFVSDTVGLAGLGLQYVATSDEKEAAALAPELREIPIVRKFVRQEDIRDARAAYWDAVKEAKDAVADFERARKAHDAAGQAQTRAKADLLKPMAKMADATNKLIKARRERIETIMADETKSLGHKRAAMRVVEAEEQRLYDKYVSAFDAKMRKAANNRTSAVAATP